MPSTKDKAFDLVEMIKRASVGKKDSATREDIKEQFDFLLLEQVYKSFERKGNVKAFLKVLGINQQRWGTVASLLKYYKAIFHFAQNSKKGESSSFYQFIRVFGNFVDFDVTSVRPDAPYQHIRFINPPLECMKGELLFFVTQGDPPGQEIQRFVNIIENLTPEYSRKVIYILSFKHTKELVSLSRETRYKFVVLSAYSLKDIVLANTPQVEMNVITTGQLELLDIQPYRTHGCTPSIMFFGRKREIDWFLNDPGISFAIYGGRQLGKTSLLRKIQEILMESNGEKTCFITCEGIDNNLRLGLEILNQLGVNSQKVKGIPDFEKTFRDYLRTQKAHHTIFIDEVDDLVDIDRKSPQKIFVALRNIYNDFGGKCRFFFAGFKKLYSEFYRLYAPFRNFAEPYELKSLSKRDAQRLIREPLCNRLGIRFLSENSIVKKIYQYTAGHPCFIQHYCKCLIDKIAEDDRRIVTKEDVEEVYRSEAYRNLIIGTYSDNFREGEANGDVIPKLIICHVIFEGLETFSEDELDKSLREMGVIIEAFRLRSELRKLTMTSVLEKYSNLYRFTNSIYPPILRESENLTDILIHLTERSQCFLEKQNKVQTSREIAGQFVLHAQADRIIKDSGRSYAVIGGNGFGKTSLLETLQKLYKDDITYKSAYVLARELTNTKGLIRKIMEQFGMSMGDDSIDSLKEFIVDEYQHGRRLIALVDNIDQLLRNDSKDILQILTVLESWSQEFDEGFRVIMTGGVELQSMITQEPFSQSIEPMYLTSLDERASRQLILRTLKKQGNISLEDETLVDMIAEYAGGNPSLMSKFATLAQERELETLGEEEIEEISESVEYRLFLLSLYEEGWEENYSPTIAKIVKLNKERFTVKDIAKLNENDEQLSFLFSQLCLLVFLKRTGKYYRLSNPYYKECYHWRQVNSASRGITD